MARAIGQRSNCLQENFAMKNDPLLTEDQAAIYLGNEEKPYSVKTLQRHRLTGIGCPYVKLGAGVRYRQSDLDNYIKQNIRLSTSDVGACNGK